MRARRRLQPGAGSRRRSPTSVHSSSFEDRSGRTTRCSTSSTTSPNGRAAYQPVLCTARPELLARRPVWGGGKVNASTLQLSPLSDEQTAVLVHALLGSAAVEASPDTASSTRAATRYTRRSSTRMLTSRPGDVVLPETVQGIIAARLDTLPAEEGALPGRCRWARTSGSAPSAASVDARGTPPAHAKRVRESRAALDSRRRDRVLVPSCAGA